MFFEKRMKFQKLHMIVHVFGEGKEIAKIAYDSPCLWRRDNNF